MMTNAGCGMLTAPLLACIACIHTELLSLQKIIIIMVVIIIITVVIIFCINDIIVIDSNDHNN